MTSSVIAWISELPCSCPHEPGRAALSQEGRVQSLLPGTREVLHSWSLG